MKSQYLIIALTIGFSAILSSCKKDHVQQQDTTPTTDKKYTLTIGVNPTNYGQQISTNSTKTQAIASDSASLANLVDNLNFYIINSAGVAIYKQLQQNNYQGFGKAKMVLAPGNYKLVVFGYKSGFYVLNTPVYPQPDNFADIYLPVGIPGDSSGSINPPWPDCFYYNAPLVIEASDLNRNVTLSRLISQVKVEIKDAIPASVKSIRVSVSKNLYGYSIFSDKFIAGADGVFGTYASASIPDSLIGKKNFSLAVNFAPDTNKIIPSITCYNSNNQIVAARTFDRIQLARNQQVIYSISSMFGGSAGNNSSFQITLNTGWTTTVVTKPF